MISNCCVFIPYPTGLGKAHGHSLPQSIPFQNLSYNKYNKVLATVAKVTTQIVTSSLRVTRYTTRVSDSITKIR